MKLEGKYLCLLFAPVLFKLIFCSLTTLTSAFLQDHCLDVATWSSEIYAYLTSISIPWLRLSKNDLLLLLSSHNFNLLKSPLLLMY